MDTVNAPGQQAEPVPTDRPECATRDVKQPRGFDDLSIISCGVLVISGSVLAYALVPWFGFSEADSVAAHLINGRELRADLPFRGPFEAIRAALESAGALSGRE
jgi:hypothetical protein